MLTYPWHVIKMNKSFTTSILAVLISLVAAASAMAFDIVDQEQLMTTSTPFAIGGGSDQELAQTFTVGADGFLTQIGIPVGCSSGELIVEIQRLNADGEPSGVVVASARVPAEDLPPPPDDFETIFLSPPLRVRPGDRFAIVLKNPTGSCGILSGPSGDSYGGGVFFYDSRPNPPGWIGGKDRPAPRGTPGDLPFQTYVDDGSRGGTSNMCYGNLGDGVPVPLPITADVPVCNCLSDAGSNLWGCRMLHPDFFIFRWIDYPPNAGGRLIERWAFTPLTELDGPVTMSFKGDGVRGPVVHEFGRRSKLGSFEYFQILRVLPERGRPLRGEAMFSYPMKNAVSPYQKSFGLNEPFPGFAAKKILTIPKQRTMFKYPFSSIRSVPVEP